MEKAIGFIFDCERIKRNQTPENPANKPNKFLPREMSMVSIPTSVEMKGTKAKVSKLNPIFGVWSSR